MGVTEMGTWRNIIISVAFGHSRTSSVTNMDEMFFYATAFSQDLTSWCVTNIGTQPSLFNLDSALKPGQLPKWGTCPEKSSSMSNKSSKRKKGK